MKKTTLISIVDDDESIRDSTRTLLRSAGYKVATFESGELFLESGSLPETECLILDIRMPGMSGLDLQRRLNLANSDVPLIFITAHDDAMNRKLAIDAGASAFFQKPFSAHDLLTAVQTALKNTLLSPETEVGLASHDSGMPTRTRKTLNHLKNEGSRLSKGSEASLDTEIAARFGLVPNFFRLAPSDSTITQNLWGFAQFAYLDNPLPSLFKERLFVYLSRFCEIRYCIARHIGFLVGLGRPAGDAACLPQTIEAALRLIRVPLVHGEAFQPSLDTWRDMERPLRSFPAADSAGEKALFACATHVFLQTPDASRAHDELRSVFSPSDFERLNVLLSFVRTAHDWTKLHPELAFEDDIAQLLGAHEALAAYIFNDPEASADWLSRRVAAELASLHELRNQNAAMVEAYDVLANDQYLEQRLHGREANLGKLVAAIPAAICACDTDGRIIYYNRHAVELWGTEPQLNNHAWAFLDARNTYQPGATPLLPADAPIKAALSSGELVVNRELILERPDASRIDVLVNSAPLRDSAGRLTGAVNIFQDVSELKRAQRERERLVQELERSNQELSEFSYAVSHDLQQPVRSVRTLTQVLVRRYEGSPDDASDLANLIERTAKSMERLIDSLLRYAQVGHGELNRRRVSAEATVDAVRVSLGALIAKTGARISSSGLPAVDADPVQLEQLFQNLISNAIKYHRPGELPDIEVRGEPFEDGWRFAVKDNGEGVSPEHQSLIFEALKRLHRNDTPGSGLGLALCKTIVARHGGRIWVESEGAGCGATFFFTLAAAQRKSKAVGQAEMPRLTRKYGAGI